MHVLKAIPDKHTKASGQSFNLDKSSMIFSPRVQNRIKEDIKALFQLNVASHHEKYLGLPSMVGRRKHQFFSMVKTRVLNKIKGWQSQLFSLGGKEILLKAVVQAIPIYAMSVFKLPKGLCEDVHRQITRNF